MHSAAYHWVAACVADAGPFVSVVEYGGRDINGSVRPLFRAAEYTSLDLEHGPGVDVVADAATWRPDEPVECVVCCEVFEHHPDWDALVVAAYDSLVDGGTFIVTAAGPGRAPHSAVDGGHVRDWEHYANVDPSDLLDSLRAAGFVGVEVDVHRNDVRAVAVK